MDLKELLNQPTATLVDVREPYEYEEGHVEGAVNIPLGEVQNRAAEFADMSRPLILMCRSGGRSGMATKILEAKGQTEVYNGGGWEAVNEAKNS